MDFFGMGPVELFIVLVVAMIIFGPGRLPEIGAGIGRAIREFKKASSMLTEELTRELESTTRTDDQPKIGEVPPTSSSAPVVEELTSRTEANTTPDDVRPEANPVLSSASDELTAETAGETETVASLGEHALHAGDGLSGASIESKDGLGGDEIPRQEEQRPSDDSAEQPEMSKQNTVESTSTIEASVQSDGVPPKVGDEPPKVEEG